MKFISPKKWDIRKKFSSWELGKNFDTTSFFFLNSRIRTNKIYTKFFDFEIFKDDNNKDIGLINQ